MSNGLEVALERSMIGAERALEADEPFATIVDTTEGEAVEIDAAL